MPQRYLDDPLLMAKAVKRNNAAVRWIVALMVALVLWVSVMTALVISERKQDCLTALDVREGQEQIAIEQWTTAVEFSGPNPEGVAFAREFIQEQYDSLPPPGACR